MKGKRVIWIVSGIIAVALAGCADNPEQSVVREKNMDKMLEEAAEPDDTDSYGEVKEEVEAYEKYEAKLENKKLKVKVDVNAKVHVPGAEQLSVYRVSAKKVNQDFLDRVRSVLTPGVAYYDGHKAQPRTKSDIAKEIENAERNMEEERKNGNSDLLKECEEEIKQLKKEYQNAPASVRITDFPSDNKIQSIQEVHEKNKGDTFYDWLYELHKDGEFFYGISDAKDGNYHTLFMQNSNDYGNCLRYECSKYGYSPRLYHADVENDITSLSPKIEGGKMDFSKAGIEVGDTRPAKRLENEPLTLSEEEAENQVTELLRSLGLEEYSCFDQGVFSQVMETEEQNEIRYRDVYRFLCLRKMDHIFVNNQAGFKLTDEWRGNEYVKKMWGSEAVAVMVNDSGIVGFYYLSPLSIDETVVEKSRVKSFQEIRDTFEQMVMIENAPEALEDLKNENVSIQVTDVSLVYTRISEKDRFDTGLVVPVWNFEGTIIDEYGYEKTGTVLSINAIDGSVINQELGY